MSGLVRINSGKHRGKVVQYMRSENKHLSIVKLSRTGPETFFSNESLIQTNDLTPMKGGRSFAHMQVDIFSKKKRGM